MAVPTTITDLSTTIASNSPAGADVAATGTGPDDYLRAAFGILRRLQAQGANVASAATVDLGAIADGNYVHITGTTTITSFGTVAAGVSRTVVFDGILTLTHNATSLILRSGANRTTAAGDCAMFISEGSGNWRELFYHKADGSYQPLDAQLTDIAALTPTDSNIIVGNGTTWVAESGATARASLGLTIGTDVQAYDADIPTVAASQAEMEAGTEVALRSMSPLRVAQAIAALASGGITTTTGAAPYYGARAWVNFNGTGTVAIRASVNVSSITDNGTGDYTINFTTAMPDVNYCVVGSGKFDSAATDANTPDVGIKRVASNPTTTAVRVSSSYATTAIDCEIVDVAIFR